MRDMPKTRFKKAAIVVAVSVALLCLGGCAVPASSNESGSFDSATPTLDKSRLYGPGESIEVGGIVSGGGGPSSANELSIGYPSIIKSTSLPDGVNVSDFKGGSFDESSANSMKEQLGFAPDSQGALPPGNSYVLVQEAVTNTTGEPVSYDVSRAQFALVNQSGGLSYVGTNEPLWHDAWDGGNLKQYWIVSVDAGATLEVKLLYALPDDAIDADGLVYLVDPGNANGEEGFVGLKAFDVAGQIQG
ncbi:hypothetical protein [Eggerthella sinensis]|uniref:hypothetical protein n=2 Tax=Eggerthella TaxID=84111 RepID=UPI00248EA9B2|nr:hypothetical protein [Eggerthella sinensis]